MPVPAPTPTEASSSGHDVGPHWRRGLIGGHERTPLLRAARAERTWTSRALHAVGEWTAHAWTGLLVASAVVTWIVLGFIVRFPTWWQATLYSVSSAITLIMVFALQHTQTRQQSATQRKLDELIRSQPDADSGLIAAEEAPDQELEALADKNLKDRKQAFEARDR